MTFQCAQCRSLVPEFRSEDGQTLCPSCGSCVPIPGADVETELVLEVAETDRFVLLDRVGLGAYGGVWKARDRDLDRTVAIKVMHPGLVQSATTRIRFLREARAAARLRHPGIVTVHEVTEWNGSPAIVGEFVEGVTLRDWARSRKPGFRLIASIVAEIADALEYAHAMGCVHRDVKPSNLMVESADAQSPRVRIVDFGLALREEADADLTLDGQIIGTPAYMSPEQAAGHGHSADHRSDIYSLGVVFYELLTSELPFRGSRAALIHQVLREEPPGPRSLNPAVPRDLETVCLKAMSKSPAARYRTAGELAEDLRRYLRGEPTRARPLSVIERGNRWCHRNPVVAGLLAAVIVLLSALSVGGGFTILRLRKEHAATRESLRQSFLAQARAERMTGEVGRRFQALDAIARAAEIRPSLDLRNEAIACMPLADLRVEREWTGRGSAAYANHSVNFDPSFHRYAAMLRPDTLDIFEVRAPTLISSFPAPGLRDAGAFSADGRLLVCESPHGDPATRAAVFEFRTREILFQAGRPKYRGSIVDAAGRMALFVLDQKSLGVYDLDARRLVRKIPCAGWPLLCQVDPAGRRAAVLVDGYEGIRLFDLHTGEVLGVLPPEAGDPSGWSYDGRLLATRKNKDIEIWDTRTGTRLRELKGHHSLVVQTEFHPGGRHLASLGWDRGTRIWDVESGREVLRSGSYFVRFSADGRRLAYADGPKLGIWQFADGSELRTFGDPLERGVGPWAASMHPGGTLLATGHDDGTRIWTIDTGALVAHLRTRRTYGLAFARDGRSLLTAGLMGVERWPLDFAGDLKPAAIGSPQLLVDSTVTRSRPCRVTPEGRMTVPAGKDSAIVIDANDPGSQAACTPHEWVSFATVSPDGAWVVTGTQHGHGIKIWDARTGALVRDLPGGPYGGGVFDPSGTWLLTSMIGPGTNLVRVGTWESAPVHPERMSAMTFSPDGRTLALASDLGLILLIDRHSREEVARLTALDPYPISDLAFTPDGGKLAAACYNVNRIQVWDLRAIRRQLREINLDWDPPFESTAAPGSPAASPRGS